MQPSNAHLSNVLPWSDADAGWQRWPAVLAGLLLPIYLLDESIELKTVLSPAIGGACLAWLLSSRFVRGMGSSTWRLLLLCFVVSYTISLAISAIAVGFTLNALYPLLFVGFCLRRPTVVRSFAFGLFVGLLGVALLGWYRFVTWEGGLISEHALGYWGVKYTESTRNSDALVPLLVSATAVALIQRRPTGVLRALSLMALVIGLPALALTFARSAWLAAITFLLLCGSSNWRMLLRVALLAVFVGLALFVVVSSVAPSFVANALDLVALLERLQSVYDPSIESSNSERVRLLTYAAEVGLEHPLIGAGAGQFGCCVEKLGFPDLLGMRHPENLFMHLFSEFGVVPSLSALAVVIIASVRGLCAASSERRLAGAALAGLILWLQMNSELPSLFIWVLLGVIASVALYRPRSV